MTLAQPSILRSVSLQWAVRPATYSLHVRAGTVAGGCVMLALILSELVLGYFALKRLITRQTAQFLRLCQAESSADDGAMSPLLAGVS